MFEFQEGDLVIARIRPERFPQESCKKLHARGIGPFKVLKKISANAYVLELPPNSGISNIFNVEDLLPYHEPSETVDSSYGPNATFPTLPVPHVPQLRGKQEEIEDIIDDKIMGDSRYFLVKWINRPISDATWITEFERQKINLDLYDQYISFNSPEVNFSKTGRNDGDQQYKRMSSRRRRRPVWHGDFYI